MQRRTGGRVLPFATEVRRPSGPRWPYTSSCAGCSSSRHRPRPRRDRGGGQPRRQRRPALTGPVTSVDQLRGASFYSSCAFSHRAPDDPIVYPGRPGASHDHTFLGSTKTDAFSTDSSLSARPTTCKRRGETAAYWVPTLVSGGQPALRQPPRSTTARHARRVKPFPPGFRFVGRLVGRDHTAAAHGHSLGLRHRGARPGRERAAGVPARPADGPSGPHQLPGVLGRPETSTAPITTRTWPLPWRGGARPHIPSRFRRSRSSSAIPS